MFTSEICTELKYYVYRLIDPRSGETFYIGKGQNNRVYEHAKGILEDKEDNISEKLARVRDIIASGFEVAHVIHRHGLDNNTAYEVEGALIDAYSGITNISDGHHNSERGAMHANQIIEKYKAETATFHHTAIAIIINRSITEQSIYNAVRFSWVLNKNNAKKVELVFAVQNGLIVGVFTNLKWMDATPENFPNYDNYDPRRIGFEADPANKELNELYLRKTLPKEYRKKGAASPVRYIKPSP